MKNKTLFSTLVIFISLISSARSEEFHSGFYENSNFKMIMAVSKDGNVQGHIHDSKSNCEIVFSGNSEIAIAWRPWYSENSKILKINIEPLEDGIKMIIPESEPFDACESNWKDMKEGVSFSIKAETQWSSIRRVKNKRSPIMDENADKVYGSLGPYTFVGCSDEYNNLIRVDNSTFHTGEFQYVGWVRKDDLEDFFLNDE